MIAKRAQNPHGQQDLLRNDYRPVTIEIEATLASRGICVKGLSELLKRIQSIVNTSHCCVEL